MAVELMHDPMAFLDANRADANDAWPTVWQATRLDLSTWGISGLDFGRRGEEDE